MNSRHLALATALVALAAPVGGQPTSRGGVEMRSVFEGQTMAREGGRASARVDIRVWSVRGRQRVAALKFPFRGVTIVELRAGQVTTIIDGRRVERREGEIWSVPAGGVMQLETDDDTAVLQTTLIGQ